ncbi:MAG: SpoIIE family protein phosphatase [Bacteroidales bacterium]|nr:SpoIIE family protein phosphatase [Bacteroidales bacterium]
MKNVDNNRKSYLRRSTWAGLMLVLVAGLTLAATSLIQYYYSKKGIVAEATKRAETQLEATRYRVMDVIDQTEAAVRNSLWIAQWCLDVPDSLSRVCQRVVEGNPVVVGSTVALVPGHSRRYPLYAPYVCREADTIAFKTLATADYDYPSQEWFVKPLETGSGYWSEPYIDEGGGEILMTTYSEPVSDRYGRQAAVITGDISLEWLADFTGHIDIYPNAICLMTSRTGHLMMSPEQDQALQQSVAEGVDVFRESEEFKQLQQAMLSGESGNAVLTAGKIKRFTFYAPIERTGWFMCIVIPEDDIFGSIRKTDRIVKLLQALGLLMLILILQALVRSQSKYRTLNKNKEKIENELHIASSIQMSMIPQVFPPFPERHDLDIAADIVPAKEVGGDLYDYFIRDEKFFFCLGDVSGKGIPASLVMAVTRSMFRTLSAHEDSPSVILSNLNNSLAAANETDMFVTFFLGVLNLTDGHLTYCNAGHNPPMILTDSIVTLPVEANLPLGVLKGMDFVEQEVQMHYDDALFLYTDGLSEAENLAHEQFGVYRIEAALHGRKNAFDHLKNMQKHVTDFVGNAPQSDDLTMLFLHYLGCETTASEHRITLDNEVSQISRLASFMDDVCENTGLDSGVAMNLNLAIEEAVTNVVLYAYPKGTHGTVDITAVKNDGSLEFTITDGGVPFDPTAAPEPDISASVEDRPIGGLGIHLVRTIMDKVSYEYKDGKNILTLIKNL